MAQIGALSGKKARFIAELAHAPSVRAACEAARCSERSGWRWLQDEDVRAELARRQSALLSAVTAGLISDMAIGRAVLRQLAGSQTESAKRGASVRLGAARALLDAGLRFAEMVSLEERIAELERRIGK